MEGLKAIVIGIVVTALVGFALGFLVRGILPSPTAKNTTTNINAAVQSKNPSPTSSAKTVQSAVSSENIRVFEPGLSDVVSSPFVLKGEARVFENVLNFRLTDVSGNSVSEGNLNADAKDVGQFGKFEVKIEFSTPSDFGTLEVFSYSPKDGSEINKVEIPLKFEH